MAHLGKSIDLYLMDGNAGGRWQATLSNWNCNTFKIPRGELKHCSDLPELHAPGVYFLFGRDDETEHPFVYVGEGDDVLKRVQQPHTFEKDGSYWTEVVILITPDGSLDKAKIKYLENRFHKIAVETGRYIIKNGNIPPQSPVQKKIRDMLEEFILNTQIIMPTLGHKVFEPQPSSKTEEKEDLLYFSRNKGTGGKAIGKLADDGFWVLKGSFIFPKLANYLPVGVVKLRQQNAVYIDKQNILQKDICFGSPSYAAAFVCGKNSNGLIEWKNKDGFPLKALNDENDNKNIVKSAADRIDTDSTATGGFSEPDKDPKSEVLHLGGKNVSAQGYLTEDNGFVVLKGSQMSSEIKASCPDYIIHNRENLIRDGKVKDYFFTEDIVFGSPSTAASVILANSSNGWILWKNDMNQQLKDIHQRQKTG